MYTTHVHYSGPTKSEVKISDVIYLYIKQGFSDLFDLYSRDKWIEKKFLIKDNM